MIDLMNWLKKTFAYLAIYIILVSCAVELLLVFSIKASLFNFRSSLIPPYLRQSLSAVLVNDLNGSPIYINGLKRYTEEFYERIYDDKGFLTGDFDRISNGKYNVFVLGDSYTEGLQVKREETFTTLIEQRLANTNMINLGVGGTGTYHHSLRYKTVRKFANVDHVLLFFLPQNDVADNHYAFHKQFGIRNAPYPNMPVGVKTHLDKKDSRFKDIVKNLITIRILYYGMKNYFNAFVSKVDNKTIKGSIFLSNRLPYFDVFNEPINQTWQEAWKYTEESILHLKKMTKEDEAKFTIVLVADSLQIHHYKNPKNGFDFTYPNRRIANFCEKYEIQCLDSLIYFKKVLDENSLTPPYFSFDNDGHYSKLGHSVMANFVFEELFNR